MLGGSEFRHLRAKSRRKRRLRSETRLRAQCAKVLGPRPKTLVRRKAPPHLRWGPKARKQNAAHMGGILINPADKSALAELRSAAGGFEAVLLAHPRAGTGPALGAPRKLYMLGGSEFRHLRAKSRRKRRLRSETRLRAQCAKVLGPRPKTLVRRKAPPHLRWGPKARKQNAAHMGGILINPADKSALAELGSTAGSLQAVLFTP